ncbi:hypothetical protein D1872_340510 [compost metagenome]
MGRLILGNDRFDGALGGVAGHGIPPLNDDLVALLAGAAGPARTRLRFWSARGQYDESRHH